MPLETRLSDYGHNTDKSYGHQYLHLYEGLCEPLRDRARKVLEIGVLDGASLIMWQQYFTNAHIFGIDVSPAPPALAGIEDITHIRADAYNDTTVSEIQKLGPFDLILDDGPHSLESQLAAATKYAPLVARGGLLIIEDIPNPDWVPKIANAIPEELQQFTYAIDRRWIPGKGDTINDEIIFILDLRYID